MCEALKFKHVHCKICKKATSKSPCQLCIWRGRDIPHKEAPKERTLFDEPCDCMDCVINGEPTH